MKDKVNAGLLALFLGAFGIQKFYLRKPGQGILYVIFCWTFVPMIASFIEAVQIFSLTDDQFDDRYNSRFLDRLEPLRVMRNSGTITLEEYEDKRHTIGEAP